MPAASPVPGDGEPSLNFLGSTALSRSYALDFSAYLFSERSNALCIKCVSRVSDFDTETCKISFGIFACVRSFCAWAPTKMCLTFYCAFIELGFCCIH